VGIKKEGKGGSLFNQGRGRACRTERGQNFTMQKLGRHLLCGKMINHGGKSSGFLIYATKRGLQKNKKRAGGGRGGVLRTPTKVGQKRKKRRGGEKRVRIYVNIIGWLSRLVDEPLGKTYTNQRMGLIHKGASGPGEKVLKRQNTCVRSGRGYVRGGKGPKELVVLVGMPERSKQKKAFNGRESPGNRELKKSRKRSVFQQLFGGVGKVRGKMAWWKRAEEISKDLVAEGFAGPKNGPEKPRVGGLKKAR